MTPKKSISKTVLAKLATREKADVGLKGIMR